MNKTILSLLLAFILSGAFFMSSSTVFAEQDRNDKIFNQEPRGNEEEEEDDDVDEEGPDEEKKTHTECHPNLELTEEQKGLIEQKKTELKEKYLANIDQMNEDEKKDALKKYKEELFTYMEKELGLNFERKLEEEAPES